MSELVKRARARFPRPRYSEDGIIANELADEVERLEAASFKTGFSSYSYKELKDELAKLRARQAAIESELERRKAGV